MADIYDYTWDDDERSLKMPSFRKFRTTEANAEDEYVSVTKILKEMYDEDKKKLYCYEVPSYHKERHCTYLDMWEYPILEEASISSSYEEDVDTLEEDVVEGGVPECSNEEDQDTIAKDGVAQDGEKTQSEIPLVNEDIIYKKFMYL